MSNRPAASAVVGGLDEKTGTELWQVMLPGMVTHGPGLMSYNGRWVVVSYWVGLRAFDPKDGREVWHVGG